MSDRQPVTRVEFGARLSQQYPTSDWRQHDRERMVGLSPGECEPVDPHQRRTDCDLE
jgi:hypothetical protein